MAVLAVPLTRPGSRLKMQVGGGYPMSETSTGQSRAHTTTPYFARYMYADNSRLAYQIYQLCPRHNGFGPTELRSHEIIQASGFLVGNGKGSQRLGSWNLGLGVRTRPWPRLPMTPRPEIFETPCGGRRKKTWRAGRLERARFKTPRERFSMGTVQACSYSGYFLDIFWIFILYFPAGR